MKDRFLYLTFVSPISRRLFLFFSLSLLFFSFTQDVPAPSMCIAYSANGMTTDPLGNMYVFKGQELIKFNRKGEKLKIFSTKLLGNISSVDASNPLRILLFFRDFSALLFLDSQLSQNGEKLSLENVNMEATDLACASFNNGFWLYNRQTSELYRYSQELELKVSTGNLSNLLHHDLKPDFICEHNGLLYLNDPKLGIFMFDMFGTYFKTIPLRNLHTFQARQDEIWFYRTGYIHRYQTKLLQDDSMQVDLAKSVRVESELLYSQFNDSLCIRTIPGK